jgi:hypothetical protein
MLVAAITRRPKRPVKAPFSLAAELRFHQRIWQRSAIYSDERAVAAPALLINIAGGRFLAGTGFPQSMARNCCQHDAFLQRLDE